jgi:hypothetical protein
LFFFFYWCYYFLHTSATVFHLLVLLHFYTHEFEGTFERDEVMEF